MIRPWEIRVTTLITACGIRFVIVGCFVIPHFIDVVEVHTYLAIYWLMRGDDYEYTEKDYEDYLLFLHIPSQAQTCNF